VQPDFAVAASYKWMLAPYTVGLFYVSPKWQHGRPLEENWIQRANAREFLESYPYTAKIMTTELADSIWASARTLALLPAAVSCHASTPGWDISQVSETQARSTASSPPLRWEVDSLLHQRIYAPHNYLCLRSKIPVPRNLPENLAREKVFAVCAAVSIRVTPLPV